MATRMPNVAICVASHATSGVFPVPPTVRLPTTMTGAPTRTRCRRPMRYRPLRVAMIAPYKNENGASQAGRAPLYHIRSMLERFIRASARAGSRPELRAFEARIGAIARHEFRMCAALGHVPVFHHDDLVGVFDGRQAVRN